eukprot:2273242-Rhodomonas_salina.3
MSGTDRDGLVPGLRDARVLVPELKLSDKELREPPTVYDDGYMVQQPDSNLSNQNLHRLLATSLNQTDREARG